MARKKFLLEGEQITWWVMWSLLDISTIYTAVTYKSRERKRAGEKTKMPETELFASPTPPQPLLLVE